MCKFQGDLVSIIVPVYNTQNYLEQCLNSLVVQSYSNLEIIMVNDGSTDGSGAVCKKFAEMDRRFILVEQKNAGLGSARNAGLKRATGSYIGFVDSDDYVHPDYVRVLYENLKKYQADISMCSYLKFLDGLDSMNMNLTDVGERNHHVEILDKLDLIRAISTTGPSNRSERIVIACNKLIRRACLENFRFENKLHEDEYMINELIVRCDKTIMTSAKLYFYRQRNDSITGIDEKKNLRHLDALDAYEQRLHMFHSSEYKSIYGNLVSSYLSNCIYRFLTLRDENNVGYLIHKIYPGYIYYYFRNLRSLNWSKIKGYGVFLISPSWYKKKYWR
ncbi:MAG: glycosyltransferase [Clostridiales bacterium]|nr:glycosyltransferase [Clostridiales bacterium]